jgi:hypothetical protein
MSGGGKGGSQTTQATIPDWAVEPTKRNLARSEVAQQVGYQPYMGADLAAVNPTQMAAMQSQLDTASAFGMSAPSTPMQGMPQAQDFGGGMMGYSAFPLFEQARQELGAANPEQQAIYDSLFGNPNPADTKVLTDQDKFNSMMAEYNKSTRGRGRR